MSAQRYCKLCRETFEIERQRGRPREYCYTCEPPGFQFVKVRGRLKLRHRPALWPRQSVWTRYGGVTR